MRDRLRVVGVGSAHGDDQIGWRLMSELSTARPEVCVLTLVSPLQLLEHLDGCEELIVVDACRVAGPYCAGTVLERTWPWVATAGPAPSTHGMGLQAALQLAEALGRRPEIVRLFGVVVTDSGPSPELSPELERAVPELSRRLQDMVDQFERCGPVPLVGDRAFARAGAESGFVTTSCPGPAR